MCSCLRGFPQQYWFPSAVSRWPECRHCVVRKISLLLYWNICYCQMQTYGENSHPRQGKLLVGPDSQSATLNPDWGSKGLLPHLNSPALGSVLLWDVFVQTAGWRRLRESQRAEASPGYVSAASELEHVLCLMLQQSTSPGKVSLIQLHLERQIFPGVTSSLFLA